ncbi:MAG: tetratricopeptide repeat protein [Acidobacteria bacterium]|nr:tetratricopeptide repeat protein [Acidobacteriota bacterium]
MIGTTLLNYRITEKLGAGGQGTVYKAIDERLGRTVVVKILSPELTAREVNLKRFEREAQLASSLDHPNICTIYGLHEVGGVHFIAMQYIQGQNVREAVAGHPLALNSALSIAYQVTDALTAAHARGVIHRDIKAGNVMVTDEGLAKVLDFGLAKLLDENREEKRGDNIHLTEMGVPYGTATYAAPEQATGGHVDHRADIFSTGVLLYEMLAGTWPFRGTTSIEVRYAVLHDTPQPIAEVRTDNPPPRLQQILDRALAKNPKGRYQKMSELRDEVRAAMREVAATSGGGAEVNTSLPGELVPLAIPRHAEGSRGFGRTFRRWWRGVSGSEAQPTSLPPAARQTSTPSRSSSHASTSEGRETHDTPHTSFVEGQKSIAILPFRNLSNDPEASFYEFSLADAVITELARVRSLVVRPSSMIVKYQGQQVDPREVGRELKVNAVLLASFLRAGDHLRVNAQLIDVGTGDMLWSDRIDATAQDIIALQDTIAQRIAKGLNVEPAATAQADLEVRATHNPVAYDEYLRARDFFGKFLFRTLAPEDCDKAIEHFQRAIQLDANFALAHSGLGACFANRVLKGLGGTEDYELAENAFKRALELDPENVEASMLMVFIYLSRGEKQKAHAEVARLQLKAPNEASVYFVKGALHRLDGEYNRALRAFDRLARLDPAARVVASYNRARVMMYQHRLDDALLELERGAKIEPNHPLVKTFRAVIMGRQGEREAATKMLREVLDEHPTMDGIRPLLAQQLIRQGDTEGARAELTDRVRDAASADHDIAYWLATTYAMLGERDDAFTWLERAINLGNENRIWFETDPNWESLRGDPRFRELMRRIETASEKLIAQELSSTDKSEAGPVSATASADAYDEYLRGRDANGRFIYHTLSREDSDEAIRYFRHAVELDPNFALAHCALGSAYANRVIKGLGSAEDYERAEVAFERALALDPLLLEARLHMVFIQLARGEKQKARAWIEVMRREAPNDVGVQFVSATLARLDGRYDDALESLSSMLRINPAERVVVSYNRARIFMYQSRYDDALAELEQGAKVEPDHPLIKTFRAVVTGRRGDAANAVRLLREVLERNPRMDAVRPLLAQFLVKTGDTEGARAELTERAREAADADHDVAYWLATAYVLLGEHGEALTWLERAVALGNENRPWFEADPNWEPLREGTRFRELMRRIETARALGAEEQ